ncbi:MAG: thiamine pyrophosphate-binding protein [Chloroflexi bacterium]|nr:thiamine pyrophosphate-binding protein [Chloroflexota bacterium]
MKTAEFVGRFLAARGVQQAFGHPGSDVMDLIEGMEQAGIRFVLTHHENTGAFMANTVGQLTGVPGVALATKGPGVTNITSGVAAALLDRAPLLCFTSHIDATTAASYVHQHLPVVEFYRPISKLAEELTAANAADLLPRAVRTATASLPGSVYLPSSAGEQTKTLAQDDATLQRLIQTPVRPEPLPRPSPAEIEAAAATVAEAKRLLLLVGPGLNHLDVNADLLRTVEALGAPVCVSPEAIGQVPADHPLYVGMFGWYDDPLRRLLDEADTVLTIGVDGWDNMGTYRGGGKVVSIAAAGASDPTFQPVAHALNGDPVTMLRTLAERGRGSRTWGPELAAEVLGEIDHNLGVSTEHQESDGIPPQSVLTLLRAAAPRDAIFSCDVGAHKSLSCQAWRSYGPKSFVVTNGLSPMGYGLASAMGAKLACPDRTVVSVSGDGGLLMYAGELATWARLNLPLVLVVMIDSSLTQVKRRQERRGYSVVSTSFQRIDFCGLAKVHGIESLRAESSAELQRALETAVRANRPFLVEAVLDQEEYRRIPGTP